MLSDQEKREMLEMAASSSVREEFEHLQRASQIDPYQPMSADRLAAWLTAMSRIFPTSPPRKPVPYTRVLL